MNDEEKAKLLKEAQDIYDKEIAEGTKIYDDHTASLPKPGEIYMRLAKVANSYYKPSISMEQITQVLAEAKKEAPTREKYTTREDLGNGIFRYSFDSINYLKETEHWFKKWFVE